MRVFVAEIDRKFMGTCVGMGLYFILANDYQSAEQLAQKRCDEEKEFSEYAEWSVVSIKEVTGLTVEELLTEIKPYILKKGVQGDRQGLDR